MNVWNSIFLFISRYCCSSKVSLKIKETSLPLSRVSFWQMVSLFTKFSLHWLELVTTGHKNVQYSQLLLQRTPLGIVIVHNSGSHFQSNVYSFCRVEGWILSVIADVCNNRVSARRELTEYLIINVLMLFPLQAWLHPHRWAAYSVRPLSKKVSYTVGCTCIEAVGLFYPKVKSVFKSTRLPGKVKPHSEAKLAHTAGAYPSFCSTKPTIRSITTPLDGLLVRCRLPTEDQRNIALKRIMYLISIEFNK